MKACQFCSEEIQDAAVFCRHCRRDQPGPTVLPDPNVGGLPAITPPSAGVQQALAPVTVSAVGEPPVVRRSEGGALPNSPLVVGRKSWVAYVKGVGPPSIIAAFLGAIILGEGSLGGLGAAEATVIISPLLGFAVYRYFDLKAVRLEISGDGVYLHSGILPWNKGRTGVSWRDCGGAYYATDFSSWLTKSASVQIEHRFTRTSSLTVEEIADAKRVAETIAAALSERSPGQNP